MVKPQCVDQKGLWRSGDVERQVRRESARKFIHIDIRLVNRLRGRVGRIEGGEWDRRGVELFEMLQVVWFWIPAVIAV